MSKQSIFDGVKYLYAEQLKGKPHVLTIKRCSPVELTDNNGKKSMGYEMSFEETPKLYAFAAVGVRRMLAMILGEDPAQYGGQKIELYPEQSKRSATGWAIRVRAPTRQRSTTSAAVLTGEPANNQTNEQQPNDIPE